MKESYIPKDQRKKILLLSDDIRTYSGVGCQSRNIVLNTVHRFNWVNIGAAVKHPEHGQGFDLSEEVSKLMEIPDASVKVLANDGYGNKKLLRDIINQEKPDAIMHFTDPRYWTWLYEMENEIRQNIPVIFYTIWDDLPYPMYNREFYRSDDMLLCISKQTHNIVKNVLKHHPKEEWQINYLPHGIISSKFYPIVDDLKFETYKEKTLKDEFEFVVFHNSRNIRRKNQSDIILAWRTFLDQLPEEKAKKCLLILKTETSDPNGTDLNAVIGTICNPNLHNVKIIEGRFMEEEMNYLYNISDCHMFMTDNEGWGLGLTESLIAGRMIIAPVQGGMQDQMRFEDENGNWINFTTEHPSNADGKYKKCGEWAMPIFPKTRSVKGSPMTPYIFASTVSIEDAALTLMKVYKLGPEERKRRGLKGREWAISKEAGFTAKRMGERFIENVDKLFKEWKPQPRFDIISLNDYKKPNNYNPNPISLTPEFIKEIQSI